MKLKVLAFVTLVVLLPDELLSQPFVDVVSFNFQSLSTTYKDNPSWQNKIDNYSLSLFLPKEFKNGNALLFRIGGEKMNSTINQDIEYSSNLSNISLAMGFQWVSKDKKWATVLVGISKWASDSNNLIGANNWQYGCYFLESYRLNEKLKFKAGLYYNREAFGDFFVPLLGLDWDATNRIKLYGTLPANYKIEYNIVKNKLYAGLNFKTNTVSFNLSEKTGHNYVRYDDIHLKLFTDFFVYKKILIFVEIGYLLGKNPLQFKTNDVSLVNPIYAPLKKTLVFNVGVAYRVRFDLEK